MAVITQIMMGVGVRRCYVCLPTPATPTNPRRCERLASREVFCCCCCAFWNPFYFLSVFVLEYLIFFIKTNNNGSSKSIYEAQNLVRRDYSKCLQAHMHPHTQTHTHVRTHTHTGTLEHTSLADSLFKFYVINSQSICL